MFLETLFLLFLLYFVTFLSVQSTARMTDKLTGRKGKENILGKSIIENPLNTYTHTHYHVCF